MLVNILPGIKVACPKASIFNDAHKISNLTVPNVLTCQNGKLTSLKTNLLLLKTNPYTSDIIITISVN